MELDDPIPAYPEGVYAQRGMTIAQLTATVEAIRETESSFCAAVYVGKDASVWWIWAISLFKLTFVDGLPEKRCLAIVRRDMAPFNAEIDRNAGIGQPPAVLLARGRRPKKYKTLSGLYADCVEIFGSDTPIDLHIHGEPGEVGND